MGSRYSSMSLETWKKEVTSLRGEYSQREKLVLPIKEKGFSSWATPNTMDHLPPKEGKAMQRIYETHRKGAKWPSNLREQVNPSSWPTPAVGDPEGGSQKDRIEMGEKGFKLRKKNRPDVTYGAKLRDAVEAYENWPTPDATNIGDGVPWEKSKERLDARRARVKKAVKEGKTKAGSGRSPNLAMSVQREESWPTPSTRDFKGTNSLKHITKDSDHGNHMNQLPNKVMINELEESWPTPTVAEAGKIGNKANHGQKGLSNHPDIRGEVTREKRKKGQGWDKKESSEKGESSTKNSQQDQSKDNTIGKNQELLAKQIGKLNPNWVEQMMGLELGWTQLPTEWID